jgi:hypothetical protein
MKGDAVNAIRESQDMAMALAEAHKAVWERWVRTVECGECPETADAWERASSKVIDAWATMVKLALEAELTWVRLWMRTFSDDEGAAPKEVIEWSRLTCEMMEAWIVARQEMWDTWFATLRRVGPHEQHATAFVEVSKTWREAACKALDASEEWLRVGSAEREAERVLAAR